MPGLIIAEFAKTRKIDSFEALAPYDDLTRRQRGIIEKRMANRKVPVSFAEAWVAMFCSDKYGEATTHWSKLEERVRRGVGNPCPLVLIGIPANVVVPAAAS